MNILKPLKWEPAPFIPVPEVKENNTDQVWRMFERAKYGFDNAMQPVTEFTEFEVDTK